RLRIGERRGTLLNSLATRRYRKREPRWRRVRASSRLEAPTDAPSAQQRPRLKQFRLCDRISLNNPSVYVILFLTRVIKERVTKQLRDSQATPEARCAAVNFGLANYPEVAWWVE